MPYLIHYTELELLTKGLPTGQNESNQAFLWSKSVSIDVAKANANSQKIILVLAKSLIQGAGSNEIFETPRKAY